jgi:large subunit ribosomal protein L6
MSRIGRLPIPIPAGVDVTVDGAAITVKGPKGELQLTVKNPIQVTSEDGQLVVTRPDDERESRSLHGLTRTLIANQIIGVTTGYSKGLEIVGTGYRVLAKGDNLEFALGYSHSITVEPPKGISFTVEGNNKLTVRGIDKQAVGEVAANIRKLRKPEPYKGKGVRYAGEVVRRKAGKAGKIGGKK